MSSGTHEGYRRHGTAHDLADAAERTTEALDQAEAVMVAALERLRPALLVAQRDCGTPREDAIYVLHALCLERSTWLSDARRALDQVLQPLVKAALRGAQ